MSSCAQKSESRETIVLENTPTEGGFFEDFSVFEGKDTLLSLDYDGTLIDVQLLYPEGKPKATLLILQGWNFPISSWCDSSSLCEKALAEGYALVCPDMGKSIYTRRIYPETRADWLKYPTRKWMTHELIPFLQKERNLFLGVNDNFVVGLSTGGRGALLVAMDLPEVFDGTACLSGDFDQSKYPNDNLFKGFLGKMDEYPERWTGDENPMSFIDTYNIPTYIGHGINDKIVPTAHASELYEAIKKQGNCKVKLNMEQNAGHNYAYWDSEVDKLLEFFASAMEEE